MSDLSRLGLPDGCIRPYRPLPADFRQRFLEMGQSKELEEHYHTNWRIICRWIEEAGGDALRAERYQVSGGTPRPGLRSKASHYVMGQKLTAVRAKRGKE